MFKNYFKIAFRHLLKHKLFSIINVFCLALGLTFCLLIGMYVLNQYRINSTLKNASSQYLVKSKWKVKDMGLDITTFGPLSKALKDEYPNLVANYYRYDPVTNVVSAGDRHFKEDIAIGDTSLVSMYGFEVLYGNKYRPFPDNNSAVITESLALKLYGNTNAINQTLSVLGTDGKEQPFRVSAVLKDLPYNSVTHLIGSSYSVFVPAVGNRYFLGGDPLLDWNNSFIISAVELQPGKTPADLTSPLKQLLAKYTRENIQENLQIELAPVKDYYLQDNNGAAQKMILVLSLAAAFILLMAIINFVNINIGTSSYRLKEIGLRKVFGSMRQQLIVQFLVEAFVLTLVAALLSLVSYQLFRSVFSQILNTQLDSIFNFRPEAFLYLFVLVVATGLIAGLYPAFVFSSSQVITAVKGKINSSTGGLGLRKAMLTIQFTLAIIVFACALTVSRQVNYIFDKDIGYNKDQVLVITAFPKQWDSVGVMKMMNIRNSLSQLPSVQNASLSFEIPDRKPPNSLMFEPATTKGEKSLINICGVDENFASTFGLKLLTGSCFAGNGGYIPNQVVLNESAVKALGLTVDNALNAQLRNSTAAGPNSDVTVAGVVRDFNYSSLQEPIGPVAFFHVKDAQSYRYLSLKLTGTDIRESVSKIEQKWRELSPGAPFEYNFMDDRFESLYRSELQLKKAAGIATVLNLVIVFLGIFGVVSFTLAKRTKEIAVRKVLGASVTSIMRLFARDYAWLILIANLIAWPLTYLITSRWLEQYAYRMPPSVMVYLVVGISIFAASFLIIAVQSMKAGRANPVKSLRSE